MWKRNPLFVLTMERARQLLDEQGVAGSATSNPMIESPQEGRRAHALAVLRACRELTAELGRLADDATEQAHRAKASHAEIGAARGVTRQAARQAVLRHRRRVELMRRRPIEETDPDAWGDLHYQQQLEQEERDQQWPPRSWQFRAPAGYWTVRLIGGPLDSHTMRVPVGDDAYAFVDHSPVLGLSSPRYARYQPAKPGDNEYVFTGEFYIRCR